MSRYIRRAVKEQFARMYIETDGSLTRLSEQLYLHKNTIKYKIKRLTELTGVDIRTAKGIYTFMLALNMKKL